MSNDRPVATDALATLGTAPIPDDSGRDAIHLAVEPVVAGERLWAGDDVVIVNGVAHRETNKDKAQGIVDPFVTHWIYPGDKFWFVMYPRKITSLRHVWSHPDFPEQDTVSKLVDALAEVEKKAPEVSVQVGRTGRLIDGTFYSPEESKSWLVDYLRNNVPDAPISLVMSAIQSPDGTSPRKIDEYDNDYTYISVVDTGFYANDVMYGVLTSEFWEHAENWSGNDYTIQIESGETFFRCSC